MRNWVQEPGKDEPTVIRPDDGEVKFCPYCGSGRVWEKSIGLNRCDACRTMFIIAYSRKLRKAPNAKSDQGSAGGKTDMGG